MSMLELARQVERVVSDKTDDEIMLYIDAAMQDMRRVGVRESLLDPDDMAPLARCAVIMHVKANYGHDDSESPRWWDRYNHTVTSLLNSSANECAEEVTTAFSSKPEAGLGAGAP